MKPPYFRITAICDRCDLKFTREKKLKTYVATSGEVRPLEAIVCPQCRCWAGVVGIDEVVG